MEAEGRAVSDPVGGAVQGVGSVLGVSAKETTWPSLTNQPGHTQTRRQSQVLFVFVNKK